MAPASGSLVWTEHSGSLKDCIMFELSVIVKIETVYRLDFVW